MQIIFKYLYENKHNLSFLHINRLRSIKFQKVHFLKHSTSNSSILSILYKLFQ